ncbi:MAG: hypothetical protein MJ214_01510 [Bacilli bacterium]|nr:hypothetical protein [Bacilli bacterium]
MRYCPNCKRQVGKKFTNGQLLLQIVLFAAFAIPGIIYAVCHSRKCPICGTPTDKNGPGANTPKNVKKPEAKLVTKPTANKKVKKKK